MAVRLYLLPVMVVGNYRGPSYLKWRFNPTGLEVVWVLKDYGGIGETAMVVAADVTQAQHDYLIAQAGVFGVPEDLDTNPSPAELSAFESALEVLYIPAQWLTPADTWRTALRTVLGMFATAGKYAVVAGHSILDSGIALNMQLRDFPTEVAMTLENVATYMGYPWSDVKANWTARILLKWFADQWPNQTFRFGNLITV